MSIGLERRTNTSTNTNTGIVRLQSFTQLILHKNILITLLLGFSSGLPLYLSSSTLQAWFTTSGLSLKTIGFVTWITFPYTIKFLWAPLLDRFVPPFLGRRRGWVLIFQIAVCLSLIGMSFFSPVDEQASLLCMAFILAFFSASQDIAINAYCADMLDSKERAMGAAMTVNGYRIALLVSGGLALIIADYWGFKIAYLAMALLMSVGMVTIFFGSQPPLKAPIPTSFKTCTIDPLVEFLSRKQSITILIFILFYKLGDAFAGSMVQAYLIREIQMSLSEIGSLIKIMGFIGTILGTILGGLLVMKWGTYRSLFVFGVLQAIANLSFWPLMWTGSKLPMASLAIFLDNFCGGMGTAAFLGLLMGLCNHRFTAFQFALLSALSSVGRVFMGPFAGLIAEQYGWNQYFITSLAFSLPGLCLLWQLRNSLQKMTEEQNLARDSAAVISQ